MGTQYQQQQRDWYEKERARLEEEVKEHIQEAVSNVHILSQNLEHANDVGLEIANVSAIWVQFLQQLQGPRPPAAPRG